MSMYQSKLKPPPTHRSSGFTLIEILVVIAIIGTIAAVVMGSLNTARGKARDSARTLSIREVKSALELYYSDYGTYPPARTAGGVALNDGSGGVLSSTVTVDLSEYIPTAPIDPLGGSYNYWYVRGTKSYGIRMYYESLDTWCKTGVDIHIGWWGNETPVCETVI